MAEPEELLRVLRAIPGNGNDASWAGLLESAGAEFPLFYYDCYDLLTFTSTYGTIDGAHPLWVREDVPEETMIDRPYHTVDWQGYEKEHILTWVVSVNWYGFFGPRYMSYGGDTTIYGYGGEIVKDGTPDNGEVFGACLYGGTRLVYLTSNDYGATLNVYEDDSLLGTIDFGADAECFTMHFNRQGTKAVGIVHDYAAMLVHVVRLDLSEDENSALTPSVTILATYSSEAVEINEEVHDYSWPDWWKNSDGEWPPHPIPSNVTGEYNYPFFYFCSPTTQNAYYNFRYNNSISSGLFPVAVDWDWNRESEEELNYIWFKVNYSYVGERNFYWDAIIQTYPPGMYEDRLIDFGIDTYDIDQEAHKFIIDLGAVSIEKDYVTYGMINYPTRLSVNQELSLSVMGSDYWNKPAGVGTQSISEGPYTAIPQYLPNGNPAYFNPINVLEPTYDEGSIGTYFYTFTAGNSLIDLRAGFVALTEAGYAWEDTYSRVYSTDYNGTDGVSTYTTSGGKNAIVFSVSLGNNLLFSEDVARYYRWPASTSTSAIGSRYSVSLPSYYIDRITLDPNLVYGTNGRMPNGTFIDSSTWDDVFWEVTWPLAGSNQGGAWFALSSDRNWHYYGTPMSYRFVNYYPGMTGCCEDPLGINLLGNGTDFIDAFSITEIPDSPTKVHRIEGWALLKAYNL